MFISEAPTETSPDGEDGSLRADREEEKEMMEEHTSLTRWC